MTNLSFRQFLELEKVPDSYIDALGQLGVDPKDAAGDDENSGSGGIPHYSGNFILNGKFYTGATFTAKLIKDGIGNVTRAIITLGDAQPAGVYVKDHQSGKWVQAPNQYKPGETGDVDVQTLNKMLNPEAGMAPPQPAGGPPMGGMGLPGGGM